MSTKKAVTIEDLKETHGSRAEDVYNQIANIGGFGQVGNGFLGGKPPLDVNGCSPEALAEIEKIRADVEKPDETQSNGDNSGGGDSEDNSDERSDATATTAKKTKEGKK